MSDSAPPEQPDQPAEPDWAAAMGGMASAIGPLTDALIAWAEQPRPRPHPMVGAYCRVLNALTRPTVVEP